MTRRRGAGRTKAVVRITGAHNGGGLRVQAMEGPGRIAHAANGQSEHWKRSCGIPPSRSVLGAVIVPRMQ